MKFNKIAMLAICAATVSLLSACTEARYAAHVVKQIPMPGERSKTEGTFKVGSAYTIKGRRYTPVETYEYIQTGIASWYGPNFHGKKTANGEIFNKYDLTAAHKTLQMPSIVRVTNMNNGRNVILRVNDRGPFAHDRVIDVSERAATVLGFKNAGTAPVRIEVLADASRDVAARAKTGADTRGYEVALNRNKSLLSGQVKPMPKPEPITEVALSSQSPAVTPTPPSIPQARQGATHTIPPRKPLPVQAEVLQASYTPPIPRRVPGHPAANYPGKIYVQAGAFSQEQNALNLSSQLSSYGQSKVYMTRVNDRPYFRVRLGPYEDRAQASRILTALNENGNQNAVIVVD